MRFRPAHGVIGTFLLLGLILLISPSILFGQDRTREERESRIPGQYIVVLKDSVADVDAAENDILAERRGERIDSYRFALHGFSARLSDADAAALLNDPRVESVSEDRVVTIADSTGSRQADSTDSRQADSANLRQADSRRSRDSEPLPPPPPPPPPPPADGTPPPTAPSEQAVSAQAQSLPTGVNRINAEGLANKGAGVNVAVIDTGIYLSHPDLKANIVGGKNCSSGTSYNDGNGHGTHVAGTIAALNNGQGVVGVAPQAKLWAVRVLNNSGSGTWSTVICGIDFVTSKAPANGGSITVANMSLGGGGASDNNCGYSNNDALHKAICRARDTGVTFVVAAGNNGANAAGFVPAAYDDAVITVSALVDTNGTSGGGGPSTSYGADDTFASFSNYGSSPVDLGAPGVSIYSTWINNKYKSISGTSMASPHVAGVAALYIETHPPGVPWNMVWSGVRDALVAAGEPLGSGHTDPSRKHPEPIVRADSL